MSDGYKDIPIEAAQSVAEQFDKDQVIIICWDKAFGKTHVTTFGKSQVEAKEAARGGNLLKEYLGWPDSECQDEPKRKEFHDDEKDVMYRVLKLIMSKQDCLPPHVLAREALRKITGK